MKKIILSVSILFSFTITGFAQNVGIGNADPLMKLHVSSIDSAVALLENTSDTGMIPASAHRAILRCRHLIL